MIPVHGFAVAFAFTVQASIGNFGPLEAFDEAAELALERAAVRRLAIPRGPVAADRRPAVVRPADPPRGASWSVALRAFGGR